MSFRCIIDSRFTETKTVKKISHFTFHGKKGLITSHENTLYHPHVWGWTNNDILKDTAYEAPFYHLHLICSSAAGYCIWSAILSFAFNLLFSSRILHMKRHSIICILICSSAAVKCASRAPIFYGWTNSGKLKMKKKIWNPTLLNTKIKNRMFQ